MSMFVATLTIADQDQDEHLLHFAADRNYVAVTFPNAPTAGPDHDVIEALTTIRVPLAEFEIMMLAFIRQVVALKSLPADDEPDFAEAPCGRPIDGTGSRCKRPLGHAGRCSII